MTLVTRFPRALAITAAVLVGLLVLSAAPAQASWKKVLTWEGAVAQACRYADNGDQVVQIRTNNKNGRKNAYAAVGRATGRLRFTKVVKPGQTSAPRQYRYADTDARTYLYIGGQDGEGSALFDKVVMRVGNLPRC